MFRHFISTRFLPLVAVAALLQSAPSHSLPIQILDPDTAYTDATTKIDFSGLSNGSSVNSISDASLTVLFSETMGKRTVGSGWATWGSPPDTESANPAVLYSNGAQVVEMLFSSTLATFGFEVEPNPFSMQSFNMEFFLGALSMGTISRDAHGSAGARLLAGTGVRFDRVVVSGTTDWAAANFRYAQVPVPSAIALLSLGLAGLLVSTRRKQRLLG